MDNPSPMETDSLTPIEFMGQSMLFDLNKFCRCCLTTSESLILMTSPDQANGSKTLQSLYDSICPATTAFPEQSKICESCLYELRMAFIFRQKCKQANAKLKEIKQTVKKRKHETGSADVQPADTFKLVKVKEEPVEHGLFIPDSQIDAMAEVKKEKEPPATIEHIVEEEKVDKTNSDSDEPEEDPIFCSFCSKSFKTNKSLMQHFQKNGMSIYANVCCLLLPVYTDLPYTYPYF
jgi:Zinc-finger associated domain (zf-AD)